MAVMIARFLHHPFIKIMLFALLYATLVGACEWHDKPLLSIIWMIEFDYAPYYLNDDVFNGKETSPDGSVFMKLHAPDAKYVTPVPDNDVHVYFYSGQGGGSRHIAFAYYAGYAYHFTSRNGFGKIYYDTATYSQLYITQGSRENTYGL
ncbi:hypothetical protein V1522DRAFT_448088 [Lipomyces starkeyi]